MNPRALFKNLAMPIALVAICAFFAVKEPAFLGARNLTQLFVGSEGTLGIIVGSRLRLHALPAAEIRAAFAFSSFTAGLAAMRRIIQRGATPAVRRFT